MIIKNSKTVKKIYKGQQEVKKVYVGSSIVYQSSLLPSEYQEVEYIESTGTQYIDTGIKLSSSDIVKCKFEITARPTDYNYRDGIYGTMETQSGTNTFFVLLMRDPSQARVGTSSNQASSTNLVLNTVYDTTLSNGTYIENGTTYTFTPASSFTFSTSCWFFRRNQSAMLATSAKVYSFEIVGKFNGIPCYRKSDGVIGFYDTITKTFFTNAGTGTFIISDDYINLPNIYQQVEYLSVDSGEPYIDTGITGNQKTRVQIAFSSVETLATCMFGYQANAVGITFNLSERSNNTRFGSWAEVGWGFDMFDGKKHIIEISQQGLYQDGTLVDTPTTQTFTTGNLTLFKADGAVTYGDKTIYGCKIWNNGTLQRDLVPCYRKSDNVIGMYDKVGNTFYTNAGTGTFGKGNNV